MFFPVMWLRNRVKWDEIICYSAVNIIPVDMKFYGMILDRTTTAVYQNSLSGRDSELRSISNSLIVAPHSLSTWNFTESYKRSAAWLQLSDFSISGRVTQEWGQRSRYWIDEAPFYQTWRYRTFIRWFQMNVYTNAAYWFSISDHAI